MRGTLAIRTTHSNLTYFGPVDRRVFSDNWSWSSPKRSPDWLLFWHTEPTKDRSSEATIQAVAGENNNRNLVQEDKQFEGTF